MCPFSKETNPAETIVTNPLELQQAFNDSVAGKISEFKIQLTSEDGPDLNVDTTRDVLMKKYGEQGMGVTTSIDDNFMKVTPIIR